MRTLFATVGVLTLTAGMALAQDAAKKAAPKATAPAGGNAAIEKTIVANENKVVDAISKQDKAGFTALMGPGSIAGGDTGFITMAEFVPMMDQIKLTNAKISDSKFVWAGSSTVVHYFVETGVGSFQGQPMSSLKTYSSTVWTKKDGNWVAVFHQETAAATPPKK